MLSVNVAEPDCPESLSSARSTITTRPGTTGVVEAVKLWANINGGEEDKGDRTL